MTFFNEEILIDPQFRFTDQDLNKIPFSANIQESTLFILITNFQDSIKIYWPSTPSVPFHVAHSIILYFTYIEQTSQMKWDGGSIIIHQRNHQDFISKTKLTSLLRTTSMFFLKPQKIEKQRENKPGNCWINLPRSLSLWPFNLPVP